MHYKWNELKEGQTVKLTSFDLDGSCTFSGVVSAVFGDHVIIDADDMRLWLDPCTASDFTIQGVTL